MSDDNDLTLTTSTFSSCEFELSIDALPALVWRCLSEDIDKWWLNDFRALGEHSVVSLDLAAGGKLIEVSDQGAALEWYAVQLVQPQDSVYLVGNLAPDWGGPTISMLKLALTSEGATTKLMVSDTLIGNVTVAKVQSIKEGWQLLFGKGLKAFVESL